MTDAEMRAVLALTRAEDRRVRRLAQTTITREAVQRYRVFADVMMGRTDHTYAECQRINIEWHTWMREIEAHSGRLYAVVLNAIYTL